MLMPAIRQTTETSDLEQLLHQSPAGNFHDFSTTIRRGLSGTDSAALKDISLVEKYLDQGRSDGLKHIVVSPHVAELVSKTEADAYREERDNYYQDLENRLVEFKNQQAHSLQATKLEQAVLIASYGSTLAATEVGLQLGLLPLDSKISLFANGEIDTRILGNLQGKNVYILADTTVTPNQDILCLQLLITNAKKHGANKIHVIMPHFSYARQDRAEAEKGRASAGVSTIARSFEYCGADSITALDLHCPSDKAETKIPFNNVSTIPAILPEILKNYGDQKLTIVTPDAGAEKRCGLYEALVKALPNNDIKRCSTYKHRVKDGEVDSITFAGSPDDIIDRVVIIPDDMVDSGGTLLKVASALKEYGAKKTVAAISHGIFSGVSYEKIKSSSCHYQGKETPCIDQIICTDTIPRRRATGDFLIPVSIATTLAQVISAMEEGSEKFRHD